MRIASGRHLALLWTSALAIFAVSAWGSTALLPRQPLSQPLARPGASYYVGLIGLLAIGGAILLTWGWVSWAGPRSEAARTAVRALLVALAVLWIGATIVPLL